MTSRGQTRREFLTATAAISATAALGGFPERSFAQGPQPRQIDAVLRRAVEAKEVPGVVAIAANDKGVIYEGAFGTRNLAQGAAMTPDTIFRIASMTKAVTSVAAMAAVTTAEVVEHTEREWMVLGIRQPLKNRPWIMPIYNSGDGIERRFANGRGVAVPGSAPGERGKIGIENGINLLVPVQQRN